MRTTSEGEENKQNGLLRMKRQGKSKSRCGRQGGQEKTLEPKPARDEEAEIRRKSVPAERRARKGPSLENGLSNRKMVTTRGGGLIRDWCMAAASSRQPPMTPASWCSQPCVHRGRLPQGASRGLGWQYGS